MLNKLNLKKISLWLSVTVLACFAIATLLFFEIDLKEFKDNKYQYDVNEQKYFAIEDIKNINIDSFSSDINIIEYEDTKAKVHIYGKLYTKNKSEEIKPGIELIDGSLNIKENQKSIVHVGINFNIGELLHSNEMQIDLFIPKGYREKMEISSSSGNVKADPLNLIELDIKTFSGDIKLKDVKAKAFKIETSSGDLSLSTVEAEEIAGSTFSGNISAEEINSEDISMNTSSGNIEIKKVTTSEIKCDTFSGNISLNNAEINYSEIETSSGNVTVRLSEGSEFALVADSSSGNVSCDFPINAIEKQGKHEIKGIVGTDSNQININTFSGDIKVRVN